MKCPLQVIDEKKVYNTKLKDGFLRHETRIEPFLFCRNCMQLHVISFISTVGILSVVANTITILCDKYLSVYQADYSVYSDKEFYSTSKIILACANKADGKDHDASL